MKAKLQNILSNQLYKSAYKRAFFTLYGVVIQEIRFSFHQFFSWKRPLTIFRVFGIICTALLRPILGRSARISYAFKGEDVQIQHLLKPLIYQSGFYIDVGCNHPVHNSNTYFFYRRGWRGICIDANERLIKKYAYYRPHDVAVNTIISDIDSEKTFYTVQNDLLSTIETVHLDEYRQEGLSVESKTMKSATLTDVLDNIGVDVAIDLLSIDVEEHDFEVLKSLDLTKYKPRLIVIEDEFVHVEEIAKHKIYAYLVERGYRFAGYIHLNMYFIQKGVS